MKVVSICKDDYSNFQHDNAKALRSVGVNCLDFKIKRHAFDYETESKLINYDQIKTLTKDADYIQVMHSDFNVLEHCADKPIIVWHTGTRYRQMSKEMNNIFNKRVVKSVLALGEFWKLGAKNPVYCVGAIDTDKFTPSYYKAGQPIVGHYPSSPEVKGSQAIIDVMGQLKILYPELKFSCDLEKVPYSKQIARLVECDIYIELFALMQGGKPYGSWGITALEAAALGKVVLSNDRYSDVYFKNYGEYSAIRKISELDDLAEVVRLYSEHTDKLKEIQQETRAWVEDNHSYKATGKYLLDNVFNV